MQYNYYFDICAIFIILTIAITSLSRRAVPAYRQKAYGALITAVTCSIIFEHAETMLQLHPKNAAWYPYVEKLAGSAYFLAHLGSAFCYFLYILSVLDIYINFRELRSFVQALLAYVIGIVFVFINWFHPVLFHYSEDGIYHRDTFIFVYYILAAYYLGGGVYLMTKFKSFMRIRTRSIIASYVVFAVVGIVLQFFFPTLLIENYCIAVSVTLVYITLQNPSEMVDENLNILNRKAFNEGLDLKIKRKSPHCTVFVTIDNFRALSTEIGYTQSQNVLKNVAKYLKNVGMREFKLQTYAYRYGEAIFAVTVHSKDDNMARLLMERISERLMNPWNVSGMAIRVEGHLFMMKYPNNYTTSTELMNKIEYITEDIADSVEKIIEYEDFKFSEVMKNRDFDILARNNIENRKAVIKFQPMLSKIYKINYNADVSCFLVDEKGNEVDMRKHIPDVRVTQALLDTDEFVYRMAARSLSFWNAGDKHGKYRAIVGLSQGEISKNDFVRRIKKILREEKAEASWISLKLTETCLTTMNGVAERNLKLMGELNSYIIVDKFGSGYGDLHRILSLPVQQVNIDSSVLRAARESEQRKLVAQGMVNLFHDVSIFVGATEIESAEDKEIAEALSCDYLMGDYMREPVKDSSFVKYIDAYFEEG
jgi:EAL domain-containing protein (putative c-di-GMP-specific phosphodiesterase class I)/GGDEF domain-containing protein